jgi:acyl-CoA dehydrogenase
MALIIKFVRHYFFEPVDYPELPRRDEPSDDEYLFRQYTGGLGKVRFPDYSLPYADINLPNVLVFREQLELFRRLLLEAPPTSEQSANIDYMLAAGELFTLIAYAQLVLENSRIYQVDDDLVEQIFTFLIKDFSGFALRMLLDHNNSAAQQDLFRQMLKQPQLDDERFERVWNEQVLSLRDCYVMSA